jgi:glutamine synthetase
VANKIHPSPTMYKNLNDMPPAELATVCGSLQEAIHCLSTDYNVLTRSGVFWKDRIESYLERKQ